MKVEIEKLIFGGQALGRIEDKAAMVWNALPGEEVEIQITKNKKDHLEGIATTILKPSPYRLVPEEDHFLSCSPWQIMTFEEENRWKKEISLENLIRAGVLAKDADLTIYFSPQMYGYRNKMEYSFTEDASGELSLAFFSRGGHGLIPLKGCQLAGPGINAAAEKILAWLKKQQVSCQILKMLVLRGDMAGEVIAGLFMRDDFLFSDYPSLDTTLKGFHVYFSNPKSPAAVIGRAVHTSGNDCLDITLRGKKLSFGLLSFFQVHVPVFEKALEDIAGFMDPAREVVDYFSGVGAIGLPLADLAKNIQLIDSNPEAIQYAKQNIMTNGITNCTALASEAEKMTSAIGRDKIVIFDPPRPGLNPKIVKRILEQRPVRIIYLSCNVSTQARDIKELLPAYEISCFNLYNFFPRTPHIESLCVLERKMA
ncbi:MAG: 23S rRNA (uracil(1939)-C(5))-methyltransferase RlmD [Candidatus Saganbacteria bacterium]|nr:23S rRNA (uracil(1939)-C(5))-methyltransferase RlmD [Candidatus Saganbacteria bacterium]